jgi:hypothetical protein
VICHSHVCVIGRLVSTLWAPLFGLNSSWVLCGKLDQYDSANEVMDFGRSIMSVDFMKDSGV